MAFINSRLTSDEEDTLVAWVNFLSAVMYPGGIDMSKRNSTKSLHVVGKITMGLSVVNCKDYDSGL